MDTVVMGFTAFWKYDNYPYCLHGTVTAISPTGRVQTVEYGNGYWFKPLVLLPTEAAKDIVKKLYDLEGEYDIKTKELSVEYNDKAIAVAPFLQEVLCR